MSQIDSVPDGDSGANEIRILLNGEQESVELLWRTYFARIKALILRRINNSPRLIGHEEDIAMSAFGSFVRRASDGQFPDLKDNNELWKLLKTFAIRKTNDHFKYHMAEKRGGKVWTSQQSELENNADNAEFSVPVDASICPETPVDISDLFNHVLTILPDDFSRDVVLLKLQGASVVAIAEMLLCSTRTVQRKLKDIESLWVELT